MSDRNPAAHHSERGTTLLLFPVAVLVVMVLGAIAVDMSAMHFARRAALRAAGTAADDAAAMIDVERFTTDGTLVLDAAKAASVAAASLQLAHLPGEVIGQPTISVDGIARSVTVTITVQLDRLLSPAVGGSSGDLITVSAIGHLDRQP